MPADHQDIRDPAADTRHPLAVSPTGPLAYPAIAPYTDQPDCPASRPWIADTKPDHSSCREAPGNLIAARQTPPLSCRDRFQPVPQITDECIYLWGNRFEY